MITSSASSLFGHPQAADAEMVNDPWRNLTNAVSPLPVNLVAGCRFYRVKVEEWRPEAGRSRRLVGALPVLPSGGVALKKDPG